MGFNFAKILSVADEERVVNELAAPWWVFSLVIFLVLCGLAIITCTFANASYRHASTIEGQDIEVEQDYLFYS